MALKDPRCTVFQGAIDFQGAGAHQSIEQQHKVAVQLRVMHMGYSHHALSYQTSSHGLWVSRMHATICSALCVSSEHDASSTNL